MPASAMLSFDCEPILQAAVIATLQYLVAVLCVHPPLLISLVEGMLLVPHVLLV